MKRNLQNGFTLVEMLMAVAIMGVLVGLAVPSFQQWMENMRIRTVAESVQNGLQLARAEAVKRNELVQFSLLATGNDLWRISTIAAPTIYLQTAPRAEGNSSKVRMTPNAITVVFNGFGRLTPGSVQQTVSFDSTILSAANSRDLRLTVSTFGQVRLCDPNVTAANDPRNCS